MPIRTLIGATGPWAYPWISSLMTARSQRVEWGIQAVRSKDPAVAIRVNRCFLES